MKRFSLKPITEQSWVLSADGERLGLVSESNSTVKVMGGPYSGNYSSLDEFKSKLGGKVTIDAPVESPPEKENGEVNGFPIKHSVWHNVVITPIPNYTRTPTSESRYAAGYYALKFSNGWTPSFCPKLSTLSEYEYIGPFTTKLEMQHRISTKNKTSNV